MNVVYRLEDGYEGGIFLAGPTPRDRETPPTGKLRTAAREYLPGAERIGWAWRSGNHLPGASQPKRTETR